MTNLVGCPLNCEPLGLTVIPDSEKQDVLKRLYDDPVTGAGLGDYTFNHSVCDKYVNITLQGCLPS